MSELITGSHRLPIEGPGQEDARSLIDSEDVVGAPFTSTSRRRPPGAGLQRAHLDLQHLAGLGACHSDRTDQCMAVFLRACEADSWRSLVAAILNDPAYELMGPEDRLVERLRLADDVKLLAAIDDRTLIIADRDGPETVNISSDVPFLRSLDALGFVSLEPRLKQDRNG